VQDLDVVDGGLLGDAVGARGDGAGRVGAVAVDVDEGRVGAPRVVGVVGAALELDVLDLHARVEQVGVGAGAGRVVIRVLTRAAVAVRDAAQAPRSVLLRDRAHGLDDRVGLDQGDL